MLMIGIYNEILSRNDIGKKQSIKIHMFKFYVFDFINRKLVNVNDMNLQLPKNKMNNLCILAINLLKES